jgi:pilus assembly protein CpaB
VSRRGRSLAFLAAALIAAATAAAIADGYGNRVARGYGALEPVLVAASELSAGQPIDERAASSLEVRRVPARFVPADALRSPAQALGLRPLAPVPPGGYLLASQLRPPRVASGPRLGGGRRPVEIAVSGAGALTLGGAQPAGERVDVVVTSEPGGSGSGRTYVAAAAVPLLALAPPPEGSAAEGAATATLGLTRAQALRLIAAESFARQVTVLPEAGRR